MVKSIFQTLCGLLFVIDCILNGRINATIMFGDFFSNILNFPFLVATVGMITLACVLPATSLSMFTSILILSALRNILVDICAVLSPSFIEVWISASMCLVLVISVPVGVIMGLIIRGLSKFVKAIDAPIMFLSCTVCVSACTWLGFVDGHGNQLISRTVQAYSPSLITTISIIQLCYLSTKNNSRFQSVTLLLALLIHTSYPGVKRQMITKFSQFDLLDSSLATSLVTVVKDREMDVTIMRIDHSIVGGVFNDDFASVFETFYWYESVCHGSWMKSSPESSNRQALVIGCGVGIVVDALINRCKFDQVIVVDNNADVFDFASKYFALSDNASLVTADGLAFIMKQDANIFDFIVYDVFSGSFMDTHYIQDLVSNCFRILSNNGILVLNVVSTVEMNVLHSIIQQLQPVFKQIKCFCEGGIDSIKTGALVNFIFFASKSEEPFQFNMFDDRQNNYHGPLDSAFSKLRSSEIQLAQLQNNDKVDQRKMEWLVEKAHFESMRKLLPISFWLSY